MKNRYYYEAEFKFDAQGVYSNHLRAEYPTHPTWYYRQARNEALVRSITDLGVRNPVIVTITSQVAPEAPKWVLEPGQSRCRALRKLKQNTVPAVIIDKADAYKGCGFRLSEWEVGKLFSDDLVFENGECKVIEDYFYGEVAEQV